MNYPVDTAATGRIRMLEQYASKLSELGNREKSFEVRKSLESLVDDLSKTHDVRRYYDGSDLRWVACPKGSVGAGVKVTCYGKAEVWLARENAMDFYAEAMAACEGCEQERYTNVFLDLYSGCSEATDGMAR